MISQPVGFEFKDLSRRLEEGAPQRPRPKIDSATIPDRSVGTDRNRRTGYRGTGLSE